jgi:hypothetical protein
MRLPLLVLQPISLMSPDFFHHTPPVRPVTDLPTGPVR